MRLVGRQDQWSQPLADWTSSPSACMLAWRSGGVGVDPGVGDGGVGGGPDGDDGCVGGDPGRDVERGWKEVVTPSH